MQKQLKSSLYLLSYVSVWSVVFQQKRNECLPSLSGYSIKFRGEVRKFIRNFQNLAQATSSDGLNYKLFQSGQRIKPNFKEACLRRNTIPNFSTSKATSYFRDEVKAKSVNANEEYLTDTSTNTFLKQCSSKILSSRKEWETKISAFKSPRELA